MVVIVQIGMLYIKMTEKKINDQLKNKLFILLTFGILFSVFTISLGQAFLGTFQQYDCVEIKTILDPANWVNISTISYPNSTIIPLNIGMTKVAQTFTYSFCDTSTVGTYTYDYYDNTGAVYVNDFAIAPHGYSAGSFPVFLILAIGSFILLLIGLYTKNQYIGFFSGVGFVVIGVISLINGIGIEPITGLLTRAVGWIALGLGLMFSIAAGYAVISDMTRDEYDYYA